MSLGVCLASLNNPFYIFPLIIGSLNILGIILTLKKL